ncbi:hypothetical protein Q0Z83_041440 [Actinoplanes sichuanensis]|uniref:Uncharacterized protein n=1 Tax=Actinoplanes sichuanensis TaxID=512349 RepID=A0ABW4ASZ1_9ACTN|nr:hypothetical protein [Actinoplanes sichuanensis]BEL05953.1 hypothetical protein Q0Z83_041440 [Actinoplanes sichuanensis]
MLCFTHGEAPTLHGAHGVGKVLGDVPAWVDHHGAAGVSRALDRAGLKIISSGLQQCMTAGEGEDQSANLERMEKLFLSPA